jgi:hypothetical protein
MMNRFTLFFLAFCISIVSVHAKHVKLLTIGNSFSDDAIEHYLSGLVEANGDTIIIGNMYIGGCSLEKHFSNVVNNSPSYSYRKIVNGIKTVTPNYRLIDAISDEGWDYISFQQASPLSGQYESYFPYLDQLINFAKKYSSNPDMEVVLHATWAYAQTSTHAGFANYDNNQISMYNAIINASGRAAQKTGIKTVVPVGTAIQNGRTSSLGDTFCRDGYHLELNYGRYTASCTWYEKLFEKTVIGNNYVPSTITPFQAKVAQLSAHYAVNKPDKITPVTVNEDSWREIAPYFYPPEEYEYSFHGYRTPLQFYDGSPVKDKADWKKRREEIRSRWMKMMGEWPPVLDQQEFEIIGKEKREDFMQYKVRFYWTSNEQTEGYLLVPDKKGKKPAVISVFYEPETAAGIGGKPYRDFAYQLVKRGFVSLSLGTSETTKNKTYSIYYPTRENATIQPLSALAYAAANALEALSKVEDVDPERIGIVGHSYGGKWAMFASCLYEKFACAVWVDPGIVFDETKGSGVNYWEPWYLGYYQPPWNQTWSKTGENARGLYPRLRREGYDLHELHALMASRPFLVSGGSSDPLERWIPINHTIAVNKLLGYTHRVAMTNRSEHSPSAESNKVVYAFFDWFLK